MRSVTSKGLKAGKKAPAMRKAPPVAPLAVETPVVSSSPELEEITKVDEKPVPARAPKAARKARMATKEPIRAEAPKLGLKVSAGLNMGTIYPIKKRRNVIGRRLDAAFPIQDERASRDHAAIDYKKGHFVIADLGSTNGTFLNNKAVTEQIYIKEGDMIRIGSSVFVVELMDEKSPEMVERWASRTTMVPRAQVLEKAKSVMKKPLHETGSTESLLSLPRWKHLTRAITKGKQKHLHQARFFGIALGLLVVAAAVLTSL